MKRWRKKLTIEQIEKKKDKIKEKIKILQKERKRLNNAISIRQFRQKEKIVKINSKESAI